MTKVKKSSNTWGPCSVNVRYLHVGTTQLVEDLGLARVYMAEYADHRGTQHVGCSLLRVLLLSLHRAPINHSVGVHLHFGQLLRTSN
jgi:hypothetical protein